MLRFGRCSSHTTQIPRGGQAAEPELYLRKAQNGPEVFSSSPFPLQQYKEDFVPKGWYGFETCPRKSCCFVELLGDLSKVNHT